MSIPPHPNQRRPGSRPSPADTDPIARGQGYTVPYQAPPIPPKGWRRRIWQYRELRQRARASSMAWWGSKALQGFLTGAIPFTLGLLLNGFYVLVGGGFGWALLGSGLLLSGLAIIVRYAFAPWTCKWIVTVPENQFWVVEDGNGQTAEYLPSGRMIVPFRMNSTVHDYVDFTTIMIREAYEDVLRGSGRKVDLEINVVMLFNPVDADPRLYARLRTMVQREQFETILKNTVRDVVSLYFTRLSPDFWQSALQNPKVLEDEIIDQLWDLESMGLFLASSQPVTVFVHGMTLSSSPGMGQAPFAPDYRGRDDQWLRDEGSRRPSGRREPLPYQPESPPPPEPVDSTLPRFPAASSDQPLAGGTPAFIPGTIELDLDEGEADIETLLKHVQGSEPPKVRRAKPSDGPQPKTSQPDFWIQRRRDRD